MSKKAIELCLALSLTTGLWGCGSPTPTATNEAPKGGAEAPPTAVSAGGEGGEGGEGEASKDLKWGGKFSDRQVIAAFADQVVLPKYQAFSTATADLAKTLKVFADTPSDATLTAARQSWKQARSSWEKTESFAFGPAGSLGYDGAMDSWPVNETDVKKILEGKEPLAPESVAKMQDGQKGMHTIEYLLFGLQNDKKLSQFTARDRQYLSALGQDLSRVSTALLESWKKGVNGQPAYREVIATAGEGDNSTYTTVPAGAQEMVTGIIDCINEVAAEKLGVPMKEKTSDQFESRFSFTTHRDLADNIAGARNVYFGAKNAQAPAADSLSAYIAKKNPTLDKQIQSEFQSALKALESLPAPLEQTIAKSDAQESFKTAQTALTTLQKTIEEKLVPLI
jgi:putative iron-regulated protein